MKVKRMCAAENCSGIQVGGSIAKGRRRPASGGQVCVFVCVLWRVGGGVTEEPAVEKSIVDDRGERYHPERTGMVVVVVAVVVGSLPQGTPWRQEEHQIDDSCELRSRCIFVSNIQCVCGMCGRT